MMGPALRFATEPERIIETLNVAVWLALGAAVGWVATLLKPSTEPAAFIETLLVGVFGAFIGGEFIASMLRGGPPNQSVSLGAIALAIACAFIAIMLLWLMRRAVGPLRSGKPKRTR